MTGVIIEKQIPVVPRFPITGERQCGKFYFGKKKQYSLTCEINLFLANYTIRVFTTLKGGIFRTAKSMFRRFTAVKHENTDEAAR